MTTLGVDISRWNPPNLPWAAWRATVGVVCIQLTHGLQLDAGAAGHFRAVKDQGFVLGGYHYFMDHDSETTRYDPVAQAILFASQLGPAFQFAALDVEADGLTELELRAFCDYWDANRLRPLVLYGNQLLASLIASNPARYKHYGIWWAEYGAQVTGSAPPYPAPHVPAGLHVAGWQFAGNGGRLAPYTGAIDLTQWYEIPGVARMGTTDTALAYIQAAMAQLIQAQQLLMPAPPPPQPVKHNFAPMTNQQVINLFAKLFPTNPPGFFSVMTRAGLSSIAGDRASVYSGPAVEDLPGLTDAERAALIGALPTPVG
jgi:GH25 family lysozyme M1 (1,4-beta-N-acetylmuramidase)